MKLKQTLAITVMGALFYFSSQAIATDAHQHTTEAIKYAENAQIHGKAGHSKALLDHAQESLTHAKAAEKESAEAHQHITESIKHLEEAIAHAKQDHAEEATKHTAEALKHLRHSVAE
jgi:hypothetical protein